MTVYNIIALIMCTAVIFPGGDDFKRQQSPQGGLSEYE